MRIAYLACDDCLTSAISRRPDAYEHDREYHALSAAFQRRGWRLDEVAWRRVLPERLEYDIFLLRSVWDYPEHMGEFLALMNDAHYAPRLANAPELIKWNISKTYLLGLIDMKLPVIPSVFPPEGGLSVAALRSVLACATLVAKPTVGGSGFGQRLIGPEVDGTQLVQDGLFVQPFIEGIRTAGEVSLVFLNGRFSHAIKKRCSRNDYRVQVMHGGSEEPYTPSATELDVAVRFLSAIPFPALASRVDLVNDSVAGPLLMELELIEPHLFPNANDRLGIMFVEALESWLSCRGAS